MSKLSSLQEKDLKYIFHPCSQMKDYEKLPPMIIKKAEGLYLEDEFGNRYMDCVGSWWVNLFGHCNPRINRVIKEQIDKLEHVLFVNFSHEAAIELAEELIKVVPKGIEKFLFADNGSSSIEMALKLSFQYHQQSGNPKRTKFISLSNAYHGETVGALGVGDVDIFTKTYRPLIKEGLKADKPECFRCPYGKNYSTCEAQCFERMEKLIEENRDEIAAVIIEPVVQGAAGMKEKHITINGIPGNALGAYLNGASIIVNSNAQDAVGDTMNEGSIIIHGNVGDAAGYAMRGGKILVKGNAGYRAGIHMKEYNNKVPLMIIGGSAGSFLGEYQAGGIIIVLGINKNKDKIVGNFPCTGMHGGKVFLRGNIDNIIFPNNVCIKKADNEDLKSIEQDLNEYCSLFGYDISEILNSQFTIITPDSKNPYKQMYVAN